jgi:hypothetical protein
MYDTTDLAAAVARNSVPALMLTLACGDFPIIQGEFATPDYFTVGQPVPCPDCRMVFPIEGLLETSIVTVAHPAA